MEAARLLGREAGEEAPPICRLWDEAAGGRPCPVVELVPGPVDVQAYAAHNFGAVDDSPGSSAPADLALGVAFWVCYTWKLQQNDLKENLM